jgi:hypothetical protein
MVCGCKGQGNWCIQKLVRLSLQPGYQNRLSVYRRLVVNGLISGVRGASYKKFNTAEEAYSWLEIALKGRAILAGRGTSTQIPTPIDDGKCI